MRPKRSGRAKRPTRTEKVDLQLRLLTSAIGAVGSAVRQQDQAADAALNRWGQNFSEGVNRIHSTARADFTILNDRLIALDKKLGRLEQTLELVTSTFDVAVQQATRKIEAQQRRDAIEALNGNGGPDLSTLVTKLEETDRRRG